MAGARYAPWLTKDGQTKLEAWARDGLIDTQIAHNMGIAPRTLYDWKKKHPQIAEALKHGKDIVDIQVENALFKRAMGYEYEEIKTSVETMADGETKQKVERTKKQVAADVTAQIFWLKNRKPEAWRDRRETALSGQIETTTTAANPLEGLTREEIRKLVDND